MLTEILVGIAVFCIAGGILGARWFDHVRARNQVRRRLEAVFGATAAASAPPLTVIKEQDRESVNRVTGDLPALNLLRSALSQCGYEGKLHVILSACASAFLLPLVIAVLLDAHLLLAAIGGVVLAAAPVVALFVRAGQRRRKFAEQLPDAMDLMIAVLRSGHSVPHAVKAVADEIPAPCGSEMGEVVQRMNLGQPLSRALVYSAERYQSYELDLIRRAVAIQAEVGGSLAELLDKTNQTLRRRLKLVTQIRVLTAQSRLTAVIVGLMPFVLACALQFMNPGYLDPLLNTRLGQLMLAGVFVLQAMGILIMARLSTMRV